MAKKTKKVAASTKAEQNADQLLSRTDRFLDKHLKSVIIGASVIVVLVLAIIGIRHFYLIPQEKKAENAIFVAEQHFAAKEWNMALHGDSIGNTGFLDVIDSYGSTTTGNLAKAYAGICYYHLGEPESALNQLKKYKQKEQLIGGTVSGLIGDCYADLGKVSEAAKQFIKTANEMNNEVLSPIYLKKAADAYNSLGEYKNALDALTQIEDKYPASSEGRNIEKEIIRVKELSNQK
ncbi:hypothetical protein LJB98_05540 [Bacteroidales bacterium OttesenSCG-928-M11]|nr:hypothetical protein [Bacteroidales bacterium OttesenSCG-928-M11]